MKWYSSWSHGNIFHAFWDIVKVLHTKLLHFIFVNFLHPIQNIFFYENNILLFLWISLIKNGSSVDRYLSQNIFRYLKPIFTKHILDFKGEISCKKTIHALYCDSDALQMKYFFFLLIIIIRKKKLKWFNSKCIWFP